MVPRRDLLRSACRDFEEDLVLYYYGECPESERQRMERHLSQCASCSHFLEHLRSVLSLVRRPPEPSPNFWKDYYSELQEKLARMEERKSFLKSLSSLFRPSLVPALGVAVVLIVALTLALAKGIWRSREQLMVEKIPQEILAVSDNLDFFEALDLLESMALLEAMERAKSKDGRLQRL